MRLSRAFGGLAAVAAASFAVPASAVVITSTSAPGGNLVSPVELSSSQISVDFDVFAFNAITLNFGVQAGDAARYNFDSFVDIFTGVGPAAQGVGLLTLSLTNGATFDLGAVSPAFSRATTSLNAARDAVTISFAPAETTGVTLGSLDATLGDFGINRNSLAAGQSFALTVTPAVPEPATWLYMIAGFGLVGYGLRRVSRVRIAALA